jgi:hypothetical protein
LIGVIGTIRAKVITVLPKRLGQVSLDTNQTSTFQVAKHGLIRAHFVFLIEQHVHFIAIDIGNDRVGTPGRIRDHQAHLFRGWRKSAQRIPWLWTESMMMTSEQKKEDGAKEISRKTDR